MVKHFGEIEIYVQNISLNVLVKALSDGVEG